MVFYNCVDGIKYKIIDINKYNKFIGGTLWQKEIIAVSHD